MGATGIALYQSTFVGTDLGRPRLGAGSAPTAAQAGLPPPGTIASPLSPQQAGAGPASPSIGNLSERSAGYETTIRGQPVQIAFPYS